MEKQAQPQTIDEALAWHTAISDAVIHYRARVLETVRAGGDITRVAASLVGMTEEEVEDFFAVERSEVNAMSIVNVVAAAEAAIRSDYRERIRRNRGDALSRAYSEFKKTLSDRKVWRPDFDEGGILEALKGSGAVLDHLVTSFRHSLKVRHWYAHGRYWLLRSNAVDDPEEIYRACKDLLDALPG